MAETKHLLLRWVISSSDAMVIERSAIREITVLARNKATAVVVMVVVEMEQKETATIAVSRVILKPSVGINILN